MTNIYQMTDNDTLEREAWEWLIKFDSDVPPTEEDIRDLHQWCERSPAHKAEFLRVSASWDDGDLLTKFAVPTKPSDSRLFRRCIKLLKTVFSPSEWGYIPVTAMVLLVAVFISTPLLLNSDLVGNRSLATEVGEQLTHSLNDGSTVQLNTNTDLVIEFNEGLRKIRLLKGEAHFEVSHDPDRPFEVHAAQGIVRAVGTAFSVNVTRQDIEVTVSEGVVALAAIVEADAVAGSDQDAGLGGVEVTAEAKGTVKQLGTLESGQSAIFSQVIKEVQELGVSELNRELAWRKGVLAFASTPLSEVVAEVSRYSELTIEFTDPALRDFQIGGRFKVGELDGLFGALESSFGVKVNRLNENRIELSPLQSEP